MVIQVAFFHSCFCELLPQEFVGLHLRHEIVFRVSMANFYLELARKILELSQQPMSPREMIDAAKRTGLIPERYSKAKTPHKTIHARLAESIRHEGSKSPFYRFARGKFGLRSNLINL